MYDIRVMRRIKAVHKSNCLVDWISLDCIRLQCNKDVVHSSSFRDPIIPIITKCIKALSPNSILVLNQITRLCKNIQNKKTKTKTKRNTEHNLSKNPNRIESLKIGKLRKKKKLKLDLLLDPGELGGRHATHLLLSKPHQLGIHHIHSVKHLNSINSVDQSFDPMRKLFRRIGESLRGEKKLEFGD